MGSIWPAFADLDRGGSALNDERQFGKAYGELMSWIDVGGELIAAAVARLSMHRVPRGLVQSA